MNITIGLALLVVCATVYALIKRYETRLVLLTAGLVMTLIAMDPMAAFKQFDKSMTNGSLIIAICSALGFAGVISLTGCDRHLVRLLTKPLGKLGIFRPVSSWASSSPPPFRRWPACPPPLARRSSRF